MICAKIKMQSPNSIVLDCDTIAPDKEVINIKARYLGEMNRLEKTYGMSTRNLNAPTVV